jgi:integrase
MGKLSAFSIEKYRPLWMAWVTWCSAQGMAWDVVQGNDVKGFLAGAAPGTGSTRRLAINPSKMSSYTRQRYWRLLLGVYVHAKKTGVVENNPVLDVEESDRPQISVRDRTSQVLEPTVFTKLRRPDTIESLFPRKTDTNWWHVRDRALMAVLVGTGITVAELIGLRGQDLVEPGQGRAMAQPTKQDPLWGISDAGLLLDIMQSDSNVHRVLVLDNSWSPLLKDWLAWRERLLVERCARTLPLAQRDHFLASHGRDGPLFIARRARDSTDLFPAMDATSVYHTVSNALKRLRGSENVLSEAYIAKGPAVIRNSVIRLWVDSLGPQEAARLAGLKNEASLRLKAS